MKKGWKNVKLPVLAKSIFAGGDVDKNNLSPIRTKDYPYPIFTNGETNKGLFGYTSTFRVNEPALTVSARGTIGYTCVRNEPYYPAVRLINIIPNENVDINYISYFIKAKIVTSSGSSIPQLTVPMVKEFEIGIPESLGEQLAIVATINQAFTAIDQAKANIEKNIINSKELFQSKLNIVFETLITKSKLFDLCNFENGDRGKNYPNKSYRVEQGIRFINAGHFSDNKLDLAKMDFISEERYNLLSNGKVKKNDILFCLRGSLGKIAVISDVDKGAIASSLIIVRSTSKINFNFLKYYFLTKQCFDEIQKYKNGAAQPNLSAASLKEFKISIPNTVKEQQEIVAKLDQLQEQTNLLVTKYQQKLANLEELKKSILEKAFKGELVN